MIKISEYLKFKKRIGIKNNNLFLTIPKEITEWYRIFPGSEVEISPLDVQEKTLKIRVIGGINANSETAE